MANTIDSDLYGDAIAQGAIRVMQSDVKPISVFSTNFSPEPANYNQSIIVPMTSAGSSSIDFNAADGYTTGDTTVSERTITLNKHKYQSWHITDIENATANWVSIQNLAIEKTQKLLIDVFQDILSVVTATNYGDTASDKITVASSAFDRDDLVDLAALCDGENWPDFMRNVLLKPDHWRAVTKDEATAADQYGSAALRGTGAANGFPMDGFEGVWRCNSIPDNSENLVGFACLPQAIAIVNRYLKPVTEGNPGSVYKRITDPTSGLTLGYRQWYDDEYGLVKAVLECYYGYVKGETNSIKRIVSA